MSSQMTYMVRLANGQEFGPAPLETIIEWAHQRRIPVDALLVPTDGSAVRSVLSESTLRSILHAPPTSPTGSVTQHVESSISTHLIPTGNPCALAGYYLAVFSILLAPLAPVAFVLGIIGLRARIRKPSVHGLAHALFAIIVGLLITGFMTWIIIAIINDAT